MILCLSIFFLFQFINLSLAEHYKGGTISWKPTNPYSLTGTIEITIIERHSWSLTRYPCNQSTIATLGVYNDTETSTPPTLSCISSSATCTSSLYQTINSPLYCTDFFSPLNISTGTYYTKQNLTANSTIYIAWRGASWTPETLSTGWSLAAHIDLTPVSNTINTSPVTGSLPIVKLYVSTSLSVIQILALDGNPDQVVRCRWSYQTPLDECGNICLDLPNATLSPLDCAITWRPVLRAEDIANGLNSSTYVVAITAEDFVNASSTTALSSIPHQMLVYVSTKPANVCSTAPTIGGPRRNLACAGLTIGYSYTLTVTGRVYCSNDSIVSFITTSPLYMTQSNITQVFNTTTWVTYFTWIPSSNQSGLQPFCAAAIDNNGQSSSQYCVTWVVGGTNPYLTAPTFVQGSASPVGTVMATQTRFEIQTNLPLRRTLRNQTYIRIYLLSNNSLAYTIDCKYSPDVYFLNTTLVFFVRNPPWVLGYTYFITFTEGVATADIYCGTESGSYGNNTFWRFTIWNPSMSSTTTPSTTTSTATTHTVTTRVLGTTLYNTLYTTTGISAVPTIITTSTTSTTSTSSTSTTTTSATTITTTTTTTTETVPDANVIYPKDMETQCLQPVTIATALVTAAMIPLHLYAMINLFVKMDSHFQQEKLRIQTARRNLLRTALNREEAETFV